MQPYTAEQVAEAAGIPPPTLRAWVARGTFRPSIRRADGKGTANVFSLADVMAASAANALRRLAETFDRLAGVVQLIQSAEAADLLQPGATRSQVVIAVAADGRAVIANKHDEIGDLLTRMGGRTIAAVDLDGLFSDVTSELSACLLTPPGPSGRAPRLPADETLVREVKRAMLGKRSRRKKTLQRDST